jgi:fumarate reductase subunit D
MKLNKKIAALYCLPYGQSGPTNCTFKALAESVVSVIEQLVLLIFTMALVVFLWGIVKYVFLSMGDEKKLAEGKQVMFWGVIALFVMTSVWGLVQLIQSTLFGV